MTQRKQLQHLLEQKNLKKTSQRALIWNVLRESKGHPSVEEIREILLTHGHRIGVATIYRTLKILLDSGFVRQSKMMGMTRYEPLVGQPNHLHFVCNSCGSTVEFPSKRVESLIRDVTARFDFQERYSRYAIFGLCRACVRKQERAAGIDEKHRFQKTVLRDALEMTLAVERRGYSFYINAARRTRDNSGRLMFQRLAAEEADHLRRLQSEYKNLLLDSPWLKQEPARLPVSRKIAEKIFSPRELAKLQINDRTTDLEALAIAMDLERKSRRVFTDFAEQIIDANGKKIFVKFAKDEDSHFQALLSEYKLLTARSGV